MPPKLSLVQFNRSLAITQNALELARKKVDELGSTPPAQAISQAVYLEASLKAELKDFENFISPYLAADTLCEGLSDEVLQGRVSEIKGLFTDALWSLAKYVGLANPIASSTAIECQNPMNVTNSSVVLPKIKLNKFSGDYIEFPAFLARFETLVDSSPHLSISQKFEFLLGHLEGQALNIIKHLPFTESNYSSALDLLKDRYANVRRAISIHTNAILDLPSIADKAESIRSFLDKYQVNFSSLENSIKDKPDYHVQDLIHVQFILSKLPWSLRDLFEKSVANEDFPTIKDVINFLKSHAKALENASLGSSAPKPTTISKMNRPKGPIKNKPIFNKSVSSLATAVTPIGCFNCSSKEHDIFSCVQFSMLNPRERYKVVKSKKMCVRCLLSMHKGDKCSKVKSCDTCASEGHHTLLHFPDKPTAATCMPISVKPKRNGVLLPTALVRLQVSPTLFVIARALLDTCSHVCLVTENLVQKLNCSRFSNHSSITGVDFTPATARGQCVLSICDLKGKVVMSDYPFHIVRNITFDNPTFELPPDVVKKASRYILADPSFHLPSRVDILLSADVVASSLLSPSLVSLGDGLPVVMFTVFGSVVWGSCPLPAKSHLSMPSLAAVQAGVFVAPVASLVLTADDGLGDSVQRFWSLEEVPSAPKVSSEELECEKYYHETTVRLPCGRYQVRLPFIKNGRNLLGNSYDNALCRLRALERQFKADSAFKKLYVEFMQDYEDRGHMKLVSDPSSPRYFIPHHGVYKNHGDTSKIRVVFDASAKSSSSHSLNSVLLPAPNVVPLLSDVLTLFRLYRLAFSCDVQQMYRQIAIHPLDAPYQCILWRDNEDDEIKCYSLCTVTYGVGPSAFLAIATLRKLAQDLAFQFPRASRLLLRSTFVDDIHGGDDSLDLALGLRDELIFLLASGGFTLKKWSSNVAGLLNGIPEDSRLPIDAMRILGLVWNPDLDSFGFPIDEMVIVSDQLVTKRMVLAQTAKLYDPCGFASPLIMYAKCFFQKLWRLPLDWDTPIPANLQGEWSNFRDSLSSFRNFLVPRHLVCSGKIQLHGFCDASLSGYSAVLYLRSEVDDRVEVGLICSKTRVSPLRPVSIPRLELLGAHLLAKLMRHYRFLLEADIHLEGLFLWTDSSIVLNWINIEPHRLKTFVANRVADIVAWTLPCQWRHVPGAFNPADAASRGMPTVNELTPRWLYGPPFLAQPADSWPVLDQVSNYSVTELELKNSVAAVLTACEPTSDMFERISSWSRLLRVVSVMVRWRCTLKRPLNGTCNSSLAYRELALVFVIKYIQRQAFAEDLKAMEQSKPLRPAIQRLAPILDSNGILRIKGRLARASVSSRPCPILLPKKHRFVDLLIRHYHESLGHAGPTQTHFQIAWNYWILSARQVVRRVIHSCVRCFCAAPRVNSPLMADLPPFRVNPSPPFWHSGMDYCGPFLVKPYPLRKATLVKVYLCIFVCMSTKAVHLEVAHDLSSSAFLDVLKRFISRRGIPARLHSDCGTNFVGARAHMDKESRTLVSQHARDPLFCEFLLANKIDFSTIPPSAPHQGGLWERAVGSAKFHLKRVVGTNTLLLSQLVTLAAQIEAILNSRPLVPMPSDYEDYSVLTPAHFLIGRPLTSFPEEDVTAHLNGSLRHYQLLTAMIQQFWKQWRLEYLTTLQSRAKWTKRTTNLEVGDVVILNEPNCPPLMWPLGKIVEVFPSDDGVVRRVLVATKGGRLERPAIKVFRLPVNGNQ